MPAVFIDTAGWGHLVDPSQRFHRLAVESYRVAREGGSGLLTTNYVITELVALLVSPLRAPRAKIIAFIDSLKGMDRIEIFQGESQTGKMGFSTSAPPGWSALLAASLKGE